MKQTIDEIFVFAATEADGSEGIVAANRDGQWFPLIGADMARIDSLRSLAKKIAKDAGRPVRILKFTTREDMGEP